MTEGDIVHQRTISLDKYFENVICEYTEYVYSIVWNRLYSIAKKEDVEEAVSDVFIKFYNCIVNIIQKLVRLNISSCISEKYCN